MMDASSGGKNIQEVVIHRLKSYGAEDKKKSSGSVGHAPTIFTYSGQEKGLKGQEKEATTPYACPDDGGREHLRNVGKPLPDYMA